MEFLAQMEFSLFLHFLGFLTDLGATEFDIGVLYAVTSVVAIALRPDHCEDLFVGPLSTTSVVSPDLVVEDKCRD